MSKLTYNACVENLLDVCGTINRTYHVPQGSNIISVPMNFSVGEVIRAFFARFTSNSEPRNFILNASATVDTSNPKLQDAFIRLEVVRKETLFKKKKKQQDTQPNQSAARKPKLQRTESF